MRKIVNAKGFSLVDLMIGLVLLVVVLLSASIILENVSRGRGSVSKKAKVDSKLETTKEMIYYEAATRFDRAWDLTPSEDRTANFDKDITIEAQYEPINPATRARKVTLTATWKDMKGNLETKSIVFHVTRSRMKKLGAVALVCVKEEGTFPAEPVAGVYVQAQGMETGAWVPPIPRVTGADGCVEPIGGVYVSAVGANVRVNGSPVLAYHNAVNEADRKFEKDFVTTETRVGETNSHFMTNPIEMITPGNVSGYVRDILNGNVGAPGVWVKLMAKDIDLPASQYMQDIMFSCSTIASGRYEFQKVVPGKWFLYVMGSDEFAAPVRPNDSIWELGNADWWILGGGENKVLADKFTAKRSDIAGEVFRVDHVGGNLESGTVGHKETGVPVKFDLVRNMVIGFHDSNMTTPGWGFSNTNAWYQWWRWQTEEHQITTSNAAFTKTRFGPLMVNQDFGAHSANNQFMKVRIKPDEGWMPAPFSPLRVAPMSMPVVWPLALNQVRYLITNRYNQQAVMPMGTDSAVFNDHMLKPNTTLNVTTYLMNRSGFGTLSGDIKYGDGTFLLDSGGAGVVSTYWNGTTGWGGLVYSGANVVIDPSASVGSTFVPATSHSYSMSGLPPNLSGNTTRLRFNKTTVATENKTFVGVIKGKRKILVGSNMELADIPAADMDGSVQVRAYHLWSWSQRWQENNFEMDNENFGAGGAGYTRSVQRQVVYSGMSAPTVVPHGAGATADITVSSSPAAYERLHLRVVGSLSNRWGGNWPHGGDIRFGPVFYHDPGTGQYRLDNTITTNPANNKPMGVYRNILSSIEGRVLEAVTNSPAVVGAIIRLEDAQGNHWTTSTTVTGQFSFAANYIIPTLEWNFRVRLNSHPDFNQTSWVHRQVYEENGTPNIHIVLPTWMLTRPTDPDPPNGGGGGEDGSG